MSSWRDEGTERIDVRRAADRFVTRTDWLESKHSFSFGQHYDPANVSHGVLLVNNDDVVAPGTGFDMHQHRDMEIITWVLSGSLAHRDSTGHSGVIYPGLAQRMSAGTGIVHSERNDSWRPGGEHHQEPVHFVQMWVRPDEAGATPGYEQRAVEDDLNGGGLVLVASGTPGDAVLAINNRHVALRAARVGPSRSVQLPHAPYLHLFVTRGAVLLEGTGELFEGDAVRLTASGGQLVKAAGQAGEVLVWEMHTPLS